VEELRIFERVLGDVAEHRDIAGPLCQPAHDLDAAEEQQIVDHRHEPGGCCDLDVLRRHDDAAIGRAQARQGFVEAHFPLRHTDDGLKIKVDAVLLERAADELEHRGIGERARILGHRGSILGFARTRAGYLVQQLLKVFQLGPNFPLVQFRALGESRRDFGNLPSGVVERSAHG
jgi:hypothetical protein